MERYDLLIYPHPILREVAKPVTVFGEPLGKVREGMIDVVNRIGPEKVAGLAATQVGVTQRVFLMHDKGEWCFIVNPEVLSESGSEKAYEGCLSLPEISVLVERATTIEVRYQNVQGEVIEETLTGHPARCFLHELDHLNGKVLLDYLPMMKRQSALNKLKKYQNAAGAL